MSRVIFATAIAFTTLSLAAPADAVERDPMLANAPFYEEHAWSCEEINHWGTDCPSTYESDFCPGSYVGIPYDWGGWVTYDEFDDDITAGQGAGSHSSDGVLACSTGIDCSGYVSILWETPWKYGTSTLPDISDAIPTYDMWPGDVYNNYGSHVIMWVGKDADGAAIITESSGTCNGVCRRSVDWSYFGSYTPRVAWDTYVQTATVGTAAGTSADPVAVDGFPFRDWRNTRLATSDVFDTYSAAPDVDESGPEVIYELTLEAPGTLTAHVLDAPDADIDLHLLSDLDADACLERAHIDLEVVVDAAGTYYLTADTWVGTDSTEYSGAYVLDIDFTPMSGDAGPLTDSGPDADSDADTDADSDSDSDADDECDEPDCSCDDGGCGCAAAGHRTPGTLATLLRALL